MSFTVKEETFVQCVKWDVTLYETLVVPQTVSSLQSS